MLFVRCFSVDLISPSKTPAGVCMLSVWIVWKFKNTFSAACSSWWLICEVFSSKGIEPKRNRHFKQQKITNLSQNWCPKSFQRLLFGAGPASLFSRGSTQSINSRQQGTHLLLTERIMQKDGGHFLFKVERKFAWNSTFFHFNSFFFRFIYENVIE